MHTLKKSKLCQAQLLITYSTYISSSFHNNYLCGTHTQYSTKENHHLTARFVFNWPYKAKQCSGVIWCSTKGHQIWADWLIEFEQQTVDEIVQPLLAIKNQSWKSTRTEDVLIEMMWSTSGIQLFTNETKLQVKSINEYVKKSFILKLVFETWQFYNMNKKKTFIHVQM